MTKLHELARLGQSIWYDNIRRALLDSGELQALIDAGVTGVTSNPAIFEKAIAGSADYDQALEKLVAATKEDLLELESIGEQTATQLMSYLDDEAFHELLQKLDAAGLSIAEPETTGERLLENRIFLFTGSLALAGGIALVEPLVNAVVFFFHERAWQKKERPALLDVVLHRHGAQGRSQPV